MPRTNYGTSYGDINMDDTHDPNAGGPPEDSIYAGKNPELYAMMRKGAVSRYLAAGEAQGASSGAPDDYEEPRIWPTTEATPSAGPQPPDSLRRRTAADTTDLTEPGNGVNWQGGRNFAMQLDPAIRKQIIGEVTGDPSLMPKAITGSFGGRNFTMQPKQTINQNVADAINKRQMVAQMLALQNSRDQANRDQAITLAKIPGEQRITEANLRHTYDTEAYTRDHPQYQQDNAREMATLALEAEKRKSVRDASGELSPQEIAKARQGYIDSIAPKLMEQGTPEAATAVQGLYAKQPGMTPEISAALGTAIKPTPLAAGTKATQIVTHPVVQAAIKQASDLAASAAGNSFYASDSDISGVKGSVQTAIDAAIKLGADPESAAALVREAILKTLPDESKTSIGRFFDRMIFRSPAIIHGVRGAVSGQ